MQRETFDIIAEGRAKKGDVLAVARLAGIMGAKKTADLIPLCHPLPITKVSVDLTLEEAQLAARDIGLSILSNLKAEIGELSRGAGWTRLFGMVNAPADYDQHHLVINGCSDLMISVFGGEVGKHARSAIGVSGLPMNFAIEIEGEVLLKP